jgi:hypothetical protein
MSEQPQSTQGNDIRLQLDEEQRKNLHAIFNSARSVGGVAVELGISEDEVLLIVEQYPEFQPYVVESDASEADFHSVPTPESLAVRSEDAMFRKTLKDVGIEGDMLETLQACHRLGAAHAEDIGSVMTGGLMSQFANVLTDAEDVRKELTRGKHDLEREEVLRTDRARLLRLGLDMAKSYRDMRVLEQKVSDKTGAHGRPKRPGFGPLTATQVNVNVTPDTGTNGSASREAEPSDIKEAHPTEPRE